VSALPSLSTHAKAFALGGLLALLGLGAYVQWGPGASADLPTVTVYKSPTCGCCSDWVTYLRDSGFSVTVKEEVNMQPIKRRGKVPKQLAACHTATVGDYVVEGHVPAEQIERLVREKPSLHGISVPGMPVGSPGMERGDYVEPYSVVGFTASGDTTVVARYGPQQ
jgi:hypothetical protein